MQNIYAFVLADSVCVRITNASKQIRKRGEGRGVKQTAGLIQRQRACTYVHVQGKHATITTLITKSINTIPASSEITITKLLYMLHANRD